MERREGMSVSGWGAGCLSLRAERVALSSSLMVSSEDAKRTVPLKSPSLSFEEIRAAGAEKAIPADGSVFPHHIV